MLSSLHLVMLFFFLHEFRIFVMFACKSYCSSGTVYVNFWFGSKKPQHGQILLLETFGKWVTLHKLPKEIYTRRAWIRLISRKNSKPTRYTRVSSDHFKDGVRPCSIDRYKIPSENLPQKVKKTQVRREPRNRMSRDPENSTNTTNKAEILKHHSWVYWLL